MKRSESAARAWLEAQTPIPKGRGVTVAVIDSGWDYTRGSTAMAGGITLYETRSGKVIAEPGAQDRLKHGTTCTSLLRLVAPECNVLPIRVFRDRLETSPKVLCYAIDFAVASGARVVNLSLATAQLQAAASISRCCSRAATADALIVASVQGSTMTGLPAMLE